MRSKRFEVLANRPVNQDGLGTKKILTLLYLFKDNICCIIFLFVTQLLFQLVHFFSDTFFLLFYPFMTKRKQL